MTHKHADLILAWLDGAQIQCNNPDRDGVDKWENEDNPCWYDFCEYRIKPKNKLNPVDNLRLSVFTVLEGWTLPHDVRKILEAAYYEAPTLSNAGSETNIPAVGITPKGNGTTSLHNKEWVGLTDDEINSLYPTNWFEFARAIEAKLKEKNT